MEDGSSGQKPVAIVVRVPVTPAAPDPAVGYRKPPRQHRFQKGRSGNPKGRPRKPKPLAPQGYHGAADQRANQLLMEEAYRPIVIREGDKVMEVPAIQAVFRSMNVAAVKGNRFAQKMIAELVGTVEEQQRLEQQSYFETAATYKMNWERDLAYCRERGLPIEAPVPHPDDVHLDYRKGTVRVLGPVCPAEKATWDKGLERRAEAQKEINCCANEYRRARKPELREMYLQDWHDTQMLYDLINDAMPDRYKAVLENRSYKDGASRPGTARHVLNEKRRSRKG